MTLKSNFKYLCLISLLGVVSGCATNEKKVMSAESACMANQKIESSELPPEAFRNADDLLTVDCLLPGQLIQIGMYQQWMSPPRPARITAWKCKVQGGQYALTSNKDGRETALKVWQECADQGDKVAQNYMGEIYGRSWGEINPDYVRATEWYRKSADQGYSRALNNLGFLYEHGLGVPKNKQLALNFYRQAMGVIEPIELEQNIKSEINKLESKREQEHHTIKTLEQQLSELEALAQKQQVEINDLRKIRDGAGELEKARNELTQTRNEVKALRGKLSDAQQKIDTLSNELTKTETRAAFEKVPKMGKYYALIIGINNYQSPLENLKTPVNDVKRVEEVLQKKYGFETTLLVDNGLVKPTRRDVFGALIKLGMKIKDNDNLLIYFAGHGEFYARSGYWLLQDAEQSNRANWLSTDDLTRNIQYITKGEGGLKARHVLVVADSCYGAAMAMSWLESPKEQMIASLPKGLVTRSGHSMHIRSIQDEPARLLQFERESAESRIGFIKTLYELPSRIQLSSGGLEPVIDQEYRNGLSVFANAFIEALEASEEIISAENIYSKIRQPVFARSEKMGKAQTPVYRRIPNAGDNNGEFFFVPRKN